MAVAFTKNPDGSTKEIVVQLSNFHGFVLVDFATHKEIKRVTAADLGVDGGAAAAVIERVYAPAKTKQAQIFEGDARSAAAKLVEKLKYEARIL